ncbi:MAG: GNAT family N-acetyltransferase [Betaproteobacteria bacterium]|jgi:ribosomal-protein-alanine N-acetyltransferase
MATVALAQLHVGVGIELHPIARSALEAILAGQTPDHLGFVAAEGALPPLHVAERSLRLLDDGCPPEWALPFNMVDTSSGVIVGGCGFKGAPVHGMVEIGYGVATSFQRRGFATLAVRSLLGRAAQSGLVRGVEAYIVPGNVASETVASRSGFIPGSLVADSSGEMVVRWQFFVVT